MKPYRVSSRVVLALILHANLACALERTNTVFKIFQFPANAIPRIDGKADDWDIVPEDYVIGTDQLVEDTGNHAKPDPKNLDVRVKVGWVKGMNRLYSLYEAYDDLNSGTTNNGFWNLSRKHTMYGNASEMVAFKLMPLEPQFRRPIAAQWSFQVMDMAQRIVAFKDLSEGRITSWKWDFGNGETSTEQHPLHHYKDAGKYVVTLSVEGPEGKARRSKVWDVVVK